MCDTPTFAILFFSGVSAAAILSGIYFYNKGWRAGKLTK